MKPIEEGCLAVVVGSVLNPSPNIGKVVKVGKYLGQVLTFTGVHRWVVSKPLLTTIGTLCYHAEEDHLMRIDGLEEQASQEEREHSLA